MGEGALPTNGLQHGVLSYIILPHRARGAPFANNLQDRSVMHIL
jgi:hypothetical protein